MLVNPIHKKGDKLPSHLPVIHAKRDIFKNITPENAKTNRGGNKRIAIRLQTKQKNSRRNFYRQIMEKARERKVNVHFNFIEFKAEFDTIWRKALWKMLRSIGVDKKLGT